MIKNARQLDCLRSSRILLMSLFLLAAFPSLSAPKVLLNPEIDSTALDALYLNQIFAMQVRRWPNGTAIQVFVMPSNSQLHRTFVVDRLKVQAHQLDRIWNRMLFTGTGRTPTVVESEEAMLDVIRSTPGAIGYVSENFPTEGVLELGGSQP